MGWDRGGGGEGGERVDEGEVFEAVRGDGGGAVEAGDGAHHAALAQREAFAVHGVGQGVVLAWAGGSLVGEVDGDGEGEEGDLELVGDEGDAGGRPALPQQPEPARPAQLRRQPRGQAQLQSQGPPLHLPPEGRGGLTVRVQSQSRMVTGVPWGEPEAVIEEWGGGWAACVCRM